MSVIGIVAEYNPFHGGHLHHIEQSRALAGEGSTVVCALSGDFVQRGEAAVFSKYARAEAAVRCGADLVVELPLPWCLSSAEGFARGAVSLLGELGCTHLSFGSEAGDTEKLKRLAELLLRPELNERVARELKLDPGLSYAAARQRAAESVIGEDAALLSSPNNILAVEYLKTLLTDYPDINPLTVKRTGGGHDGAGSALELRERLRAGEDVLPELPPEAAEVFRRETGAGRVCAARGNIELALLSRLRALPLSAFELLPDAADGLGRRLYQAVSEEPTLDAVLAAAKTRRYAMSRIRRMLCCAALGVEEGMAAGKPPYARVLAASARGCAHLRSLRGSALPIIMKPAALREIGGEALRCFELGAAAHDLFVLGYPNELERRGGGDWRESPRIL
ncbi:MAG: nucleotidyltransferase family protein [Oscillospiraceae bacterium]|nr:nucleotidyltransferase family protein [Oscillospiraceae bacterium]